MVGKAGVKMLIVRALTKCYVISVLIIIAVAFPDQGKRDFVLSRVINVLHLIIKFEDIHIFGILVSY